MRTSERAGKIGSVAALLVLAGSVGVNVLQARRIQELVDPEPVKQLVGKRLRPLHGVGRGGGLATIGFEKRPTVIYFFSTTCRWCEQNWENVKALHAFSSDRYRFVAAATEGGLEAFAKARQLDFEILGNLDSASIAEFGRGPTPRTLVVTRDGVVSQEWIGAFMGRTERQVEDLFGVSLPGLRPVRLIPAEGPK